MKKRAALMLTLVLAVLALTAMPVFAAVAPIDSRWEPDPLQPGAQWWRDTANQNDIVQYYNDMYPWDPWNPRVENVADGVYVVRGIGLSNVVALIGGTEWVLIDSLDCPINMQLAMVLLRQYVGTRHLTAMIYTSEDYAHYSGSSVVAPLYSLRVYANANFLPALAARSARPEFFIYNLLLNGAYLTVGPDGKIAPSNTIGKFPFQYPTDSISVPTSLSLAGFNIDLIPVNSANDADMMVWLPDQQTLVAGDTWSPSFPGIGPLNGTGCEVPDWASALNTIMSLNPDVMVPTHGPVISSNAEINTVLTGYRDAMQYVYDATQALISQGASQDDAAAQVQLPEPWASDPYLQPFVSSIASAVKGIYNPGDWWFNGEPPELASTLTTAIRADMMDEMAGSIEHMLATALNAELTANDLPSAERALLMAWATYQADPDNILADRIYTQALRKNAFMQRCNQIRNYYLSIALQVEMQMPADTTPPEVAITAPENGAVYDADSVPAAEYTVTDDSDPYPTVAVEGWSDEVGEHTMTVTATDFAGNAGCASVTYTVKPPVIEVTIDIKPGSLPNSINLGSKGVVPVAVLTTADFDAGTINPDTVIFAGAAQTKWHLEDIDGDGDIDLLLQFKTQDLNLTATSTEATLTGQTCDGQQITGTDSVNIVPANGKK